MSNWKKDVSGNPAFQKMMVKKDAAQAKTIPFQDLDSLQFESRAFFLTLIFYSFSRQLNKITDHYQL
jgi:hypothetical protein